MKYDQKNKSDNVREIAEFLSSINIKFDYYIEESKDRGIKLFTPVFSFKAFDDSSIEIRYVNSIDFKIDYSKRWGPEFIGISPGYFAKISQAKKKEGIRVIWIKDYEWNEYDDVIDPDGNLRKNYHRKQEVLKSYIRNATGNIKNRIYARDCEVRVVPSRGTNNEATSFLETYCFYGKRNATLTLGLYLKKDKCGLKKDTLVFLTSFGANFYGNKGKTDDETTIEVIRVGTITNTQVIGGSSKLLKHFINNYPTLTINRKGKPIDIKVNKIVYYVDADHNNGSSLSSTGYKFESWNTAGGFHNYAAKDINIPELKVEKNSVFQRKPMIHKKIMELMQSGHIISIGNAGTIVYYVNREDLLD